MTMTNERRRLTRDDVEAAFAKALGETEGKARTAAPRALVVAGAVALTALTVAYLAGRRRGKRATTRIEIRQL
jgi:uncharacterized OsmC-like protein